jgi:hypothetical protein
VSSEYKAGAKKIPASPLEGRGIFFYYYYLVLDKIAIFASQIA